MSLPMKHGYKAIASLLFFAVFCFAPMVNLAHAQYVSTTTVYVSICGNGIVDPGEVCDDGIDNGQYATSSAGKNCLPNCQGYGPYCGDGILQEAYGEQCDDGPLNGTTGDGCSATCQLVSTAPLPGPTTAPSGGGGGSYSPGSPVAPNPTKVIIEGMAYPDASVNVLDDGQVIGVVQADSSGKFYFSTTNVSPGVATFGFWAEDSLGLKSIALTTTVTVTANAATTITGEFIPPTITIDKRQLQKGDTLTISGESAPSVTVEAHVHSGNDILITTTTDQSGNWKMLFNTDPLQNNELHTVDADFITNANGAVSRSEISQSISFFIGAGSAGKSYIEDLNGDGKVNLADFSILLYYWGTNYPPAEFDGGTKVDLQDLSILLYYWTG
jgi:cysteine-rich repeat protein